MQIPVVIKKCKLISRDTKGNTWSTKQQKIYTFTFIHTILYLYKICSDNIFAILSLCSLCKAFFDIPSDLLRHGKYKIDNQLECGAKRGRGWNKNGSMVEVASHHGRNVPPRQMPRIFLVQFRENFRIDKKWCKFYTPISIPIACFPREIFKS